jgi:predicted unusual protein kinase regulating ubiquinone biosynthesis (AarF/ABC1/UbiB family)
MNLLWFLTSIIQYKLSWDKAESIKKIKCMIDEAGTVWQKFTQTLSGQEDLIGRDLAMELQDILYNCPTHSDKYSRKVIRDDFGNKYDLSDMELIGSGTIAQVYRVGNVCIKVRHPNVAYEVHNAVESYNSIRNKIPFMPVMLRQVCDNFFQGIEEQLDFHKEFANGQLFKELIHKGTRPEHNLYVIPNMLDRSKECLVMEYEPSQPLVIKGRSDVDKHILVKALHGVLHLYAIGVIRGFIHADLHFGNYGIRGSVDDLQIVIYDFGHVYDVRDFPYDHRCKYVKAIEQLEFASCVQCLMIDEYHETQIINNCGEIQFGNKINFDKNVKYMLQYLVLNNVPMNKSIFQTTIALEKTSSTSELLLEIERDEKYGYMQDVESIIEYFSHFPYDDMKILVDVTTVSPP